MKRFIAYLSIMLIVFTVTACRMESRKDRKDDVDSGSQGSSQSAAQDDSQDDSQNNSGDGSNDDSDDSAEPTANLVETAEGDQRLADFVAALQASGVDAELRADGNKYTVFAPTADAFAALDAQVRQSLLDDPQVLANLLRYHIIPGEVDSVAAISAAGTKVQTLNKQSFGVSLVGETLRVNNAGVIETDMMASNGVIHFIDQVLFPPTERAQTSDNIVDIVSNDENFTSLLSALQATGLNTPLAGEESFTVFAPSNEAFAALGEETLNRLLAHPDVLTEILQQHILVGEVNSIDAFALNGREVSTLANKNISLSMADHVLRFGGASITPYDIYTANGVIHVIDTVVIGDVEIPSATTASVLDVLTENSDYSTLVTALEASSLDSVLSDGDRAFTLFAPDNTAFAALGQEQLDALLADPDQLSDILLYHVLPDASVLVDSATTIATSNDSLVATANGDSVALSLNNDTLFINSAEVNSPNLMADNGVIHGINKVLTPPKDSDQSAADNLLDSVINGGDFTTLVTALQTAGLDSMLTDSDANLTIFAPTDAAFAALPDGALDVLLGDPDLLRQVLQQHILAEAELDAVSVNALNGQSVTTVGANTVEILVDNGELRIGGAMITDADMRTTNGIIHAIDQVIVGDIDIPVSSAAPSLMDAIANDADFSTLNAALVATGLDAVLADSNQQYTLLAPRDTAFAALGEDKVNALLADPDSLRDILLYHVLAGEVLAESANELAVSNDKTVSTLGQSDIVLSLRDDQLYANLSRLVNTDISAGNGVIHVLDKVLLPPTEKGQPVNTIVETLMADERFSKLVNLLVFNYLDKVLADEDQQFTVFAPTNDAFAKIPTETLAPLFKDRRKLKRLLSQHIVVGEELGSLALFGLNGYSVDTLAKNDIALRIIDGQLEVEGVQIQVFDIYTRNGVIHVIDTVISETLK